LNIFFVLFLPIILICTLLNLIAREQNKRLYQIAGWSGLLLTAWVGTPIHEFSHLVAALISGHKIDEIKLFKPDQRTGTLGYITHSYNQDNFYQSIIGNTVIAVAPFFGGALAIYLMIYFFLPGFSLYSAEVPSVYYITADNALSWQSYILFGETTLEFFKYLILTVQNTGLHTQWQFYLLLFILFGIANHLSPSFSDFRNFWQPLAIIIIFMTLLNLIISPFIANSMTIIAAAAKYILLVMPILLLALFISACGLLITYGFYTIISIFKN